MAEIYVTSTADSGEGSLRAAIADAQDGDVILFDAGVFPAGQTTAILLSSPLQINKSVSIYGGESDGAGGYTSGATKRFYVYREIDDVRTKVVISDPDDAQEGETVLFSNVCRAALDGQGSVRGIQTGLSAEFTISGIAFNNTGVTIGGNSVGTLDQCYVANATAQNGAGIFIVSSAVATINDCAIYNCTTTGIGGGTYVRDDNNIATFNNCCFDSCSANGGGGFVSYNTSQSTFNCCVFYGNTSLGSGGTFQLNTSSRVTLNDCYIVRCKATNGVVYATNNSVFICNRCTFVDCNSIANGGALYAASNSQCDLTDCFITNCSASAGGGGLYLNNTSNSVFNNCQITNCSAKNGGGIYSNATAQSTFIGCVIRDNIVSDNGAGGYIYTSSTINIVDCVFENNPISILQNSIANITRSTFSSLVIGSTSGTSLATVNIDGITTAKTLTLRSLGAVTIADGAALSITDSATFATDTQFTSDGRGYLAVAPGIDSSAATLTNVVLCAYGADVSSFAEVDGVLEWSADDPSVSVLIEREDNDAWTTLAQTTGESLDYYLPPKVNLRLFDGERFLTTATPDSRTYFYIGGAEGSFDDAEDWSLTKDGTAIPQSPTITDCAFVIQGAEGDVAISKGSANVTNATIIPAGTNDIAVTVDEATVLAGTERFTGTLTTTGDVAIAGDASKLAIVVDGTLEVAGSLKLAALTLTSGSSVVFASADDVLVVTGSATVNDATFSCEEPTAYFTAPVGTDLTQATFTNVYVATKGAEVVSVTGSRFGKNYSINIISEDNTLPVTVEYRLEGTTEWIVADPAFVGTTFQIRLDDDATFRVYNGEKFTEATMKVYGLYNEMAAIVEIGYLI